MQVSRTNLINEQVVVLEGACQNQKGVIRGVFQSDAEVRFVVELENGQIIQKSANSFRVLREAQAASMQRDLFG